MFGVLSTKQYAIPLTIDIAEFELMEELICTDSLGSIRCIQNRHEHQHPRKKRLLIRAKLYSRRYRDITISTQADIAAAAESCNRKPDSVRFRHHKLNNFGVQTKWCGVLCRVRYERKQLKYQFPFTKQERPTCPACNTQTYHRSHANFLLNMLLGDSLMVSLIICLTYCKVLPPRKLNFSSSSIMQTSHS